MRKKLLLLSIGLFVLLCSSLLASVEAASMWSHIYGGTGADLAWSLVATSDGGYAIAGGTKSFGAGSFDFLLVKTDAFGNMEWNQTYGGTGYDFANSLVATSDGGYAIAGTWNYSEPPSEDGGHSDFWLVKTDAVGNMQWNKTYGGIGKDQAYSLVATLDGGYAIAGHTNSSGAGDRDFWLVKTDAFGNMEWNKTYGGTSFDFGWSLVATSDGGYAIVGDTASFGAGQTDFWLVKTDTFGNMEWNQTYGGTGDEEVRSLVATSDGGYAITGLTRSFGAGKDDFWLVKTDTFGNMQWNKTYGGTGNDMAWSLVATSDGGYAIAGTWNYSLLPNYLLAAGEADFWLVKTNSNGVMEWNQTYGGTEDDVAYSLVATSDGGYAIAGTWNYSLDPLIEDFLTGGDFWLVKTDESGVVPEYSSLLVPALVLTATAFIIINKKRLPHKRS